MQTVTIWGMSLFERWVWTNVCEGCHRVTVRLLIVASGWCRVASEQLSVIGEETGRTVGGVEPGQGGAGNEVKNRLEGRAS